MNITPHPLAQNHEALVTLHPDHNDQLAHISDHASAIEGHFDGIAVQFTAPQQQPIRTQINAARARCAAAITARTTSNMELFNKNIQRALNHLNNASEQIAQHQQQPEVAHPDSESEASASEGSHGTHGTPPSDRTSRDSIPSINSHYSQDTNESNHSVDSIINGPNAEGPLFADQMEGEDHDENQEVQQAPPQNPPAAANNNNQGAAVENDLQVEDFE